MIVGSLVVVLCGCAASLADIRKTQPQQSGTFATPPAVLASCVQHRIDKITSPYQSRLVVSPDQKEYYLTATRNADSLAKEPLIGYDLFIVGFNDGSLVELREGASDGRALAKRVWPIVEVCGQQSAAPNTSAPFIQP
ncbi:MAG: hypothetical protein P0111_05610 [Nitrospira sp.]|nr:hypothetical protein [Nitrospira sp.]